MYESEFLEGHVYNPDYDRVPLSSYFSQIPPYFSGAEDPLSGGFFDQISSSAYFPLPLPQSTDLVPATISLGGQPKPVPQDVLLQQLTQQYEDPATDSPVHYIAPLVSSPQPSPNSGSLLFQSLFAVPNKSSWRDSWPTRTPQQPLAPNADLVPRPFDSLDASLDDAPSHNHDLLQRQLPLPADILDAPRKLPISLPSISPFDSPSPEAHNLSPKPSPRRYSFNKTTSPCVSLPQPITLDCNSLTSDPIQINFVTPDPDPPLQVIVPTTLDIHELLNDEYSNFDDDSNLSPRGSGTTEAAVPGSSGPSMNNHQASSAIGSPSGSPKFDLPVFDLERWHQDKVEGEISPVSTAHGTKRRLGEDDGDGTGPGRANKRGKVVHRGRGLDFNISPPIEDNSANNTMRDVVVVDPALNTRSTTSIQSGQMSCEEMFRHLVDHGCMDLSLRVDPSQYSSGLIAGGAFGDVWKGKLIDGTEVAVKVWRFTSLLHNGSKSMKRAMREIYYWSKVKHEYVQELMGVVMFQGRLGMVSRWMNHGNLREYLCKNPEVDRYPLCVQVAIGVAYLHSRDMIHGDLKGMNVLVSPDGIAKLSDFDHSIMSECSLAFSDTSKLGGGTTRWMAPELILDSNCRRSAYTEIYALGMTMLEILTGNIPYYPQYREDIHVIMAVMKKVLPNRPIDVFGDNVRDNKMWDLLLGCWSHNPIARPKADEVVESLQVIVALSATNIAS